MSELEDYYEKDKFNFITLYDVIYEILKSSKKAHGFFNSAYVKPKYIKILNVAFNEVFGEKFENPETKDEVIKNLGDYILKFQEQITDSNIDIIYRKAGEDNRFKEEGFEIKRREDGKGNISALNQMFLSVVESEKEITRRKKFLKEYKDQGNNFKDDVRYGRDKSDDGDREDR